LEAKKADIFAANEQDVTETKKKGVSNAFIQRLTVTDAVFTGIVGQLRTVAKLSDPIGELMEERTLPNGILLQKKRFPIGVIAMIYESRPNVTVDVAGLCLKSGNSVLLKGGSESLATNRVLVACIHSVLQKFGVAEGAVTFLDDVSHETVAELLQRSDIIDVVIPRGSYALTSAVAEKSRIPVLYHAAGGARMYIDKSANIDQAIELCVNSKTNKTGVCNALDVVLVHKNIAEKVLPEIDTQLTEKKFVIRADQQAMNFMPHATKATEEDFATEFLDSILAVKVVDSSDEALSFIKKHTHHHTEVLVAEEKKLIEQFINEIDAAGLMINCASRLHDGGEFGMGAEMGTATGKLHARGPVGVKELTTYKWIAYGKGQIKR
ncbi:MAG TPA: glutamate-5-semialdehyde dehydrogenase, partial [Patescibacteria group bacterium]|nr:glutamate-5-semialdehyde dehydrogenase [Patescibacteria group bacterium]